VPDATSESSTPSPTKEKLPDAIAEGSRLSPIKGKGKVLALPLETTGLMHERPAAHHQSGPEHPHRSEAGPDAIRKDRRNSQG
jgi:hypothetical protein